MGIRICEIVLRVIFRNGAAVTLAVIAGLAGSGSAAVQFNRDVRPILSENCFHCHGADANRRKGKLRLDTAEGAAKEGVIVAGKPEDSELVRRVFTDAIDDQMPPPDSNRHLTPQQKQILKAWVDEGGKYDVHWAFQSPRRPEAPKVQNRGWVRNAVDEFVLARLEAEKLSPMPAAPIETLLRRASFDLIGLPASPDQIRRWSHAKDPVAAAADELLASPQFGERMAVDWMDVARYADTHGFNNDSSRSMWRWRDWVIGAFNKNMPYDRFITQQLAGDLLPNPSLDQLIATGFNRNHVINSEGGIIDEEYRVEYVADRVRTTSTAWLGLTMECAKCHDHKFDPISQKDYYRFFAFFNNVAEHGEDGRVANAAPMISSPTEAQQDAIAEQGRIARRNADLISTAIAARDWSHADFSKLVNDSIRMEATNVLVALSFDPGAIENNVVSNAAPNGKPFRGKTAARAIDAANGRRGVLFDGLNALKTESLKGDTGKGWVFAAWVRRDAEAEMPIFSTASFNVPESSGSYGSGVEIRLSTSGAVDARLAIRWPAYSVNVVSRQTLATGEWHHVVVARDGSPWAKGVRIFIDGEECDRETRHDDTQSPVGLSGAAQLGGSGDTNSRSFIGGLADVRVLGAPFKVEQLASWSRSEALRNAVLSPARTPAQESMAREAWLANEDQKIEQAVAAKRAAEGKRLALQREAPTTMVMRELENTRVTHVLFRGEYDKPREEVEPGVPGFLAPFPSDLPKNRLGLARWLTSREHPLTSRVVVNRFWQSIFGTGIVKSAEDFGMQSEWPSHPELLDWLATEFMESGWNVKHLLKLIVTSSTYRQDSRSTPELTERDPENRLLARGPRIRLPAEMIRDQALAVSGLLNQQVGGPPVYPYQPANLYKGIVVAADYPGTSYSESKGADLFRRSLYTFWKRTVPHPTLTTFDAPDREVCVARRLKTNTPLQALGLMNDRIQLEAAGRLAERMVTEGGSDPRSRISYAFQLATARAPQEAEARELAKLVEKRMAFYREHGDEAKAYLGAVGLSRAESQSELAAYANAASLILNLDETISKN